MAVLDVKVVSTDQALWAGEAKSLKGRTVDGDIGILPGHTPVLAVLAEGELVIEPVEGSAIKAHVKGGFFSVDNDQVTVVAGEAELES